jgi:hypothetical protein
MSSQTAVSMSIPTIRCGKTTMSELKIKVKGKSIGPGTQVLIKGARGKFIFMYPTWSKEGRLSLTFIGGPRGHECWRSFYPDRVKKVL